MIAVLASGFALGLSLIVAIGPQNALLIKQGIRRQAVPILIAICALTDIILIFAGTAGVGFLVDRFPQALVVLKYAGAAYLTYFTVLCFRDALRPGASPSDDTATTQPIESFDGASSSGLSQPPQGPQHPALAQELAQEHGHEQGRGSAVRTKAAARSSTPAASRDWVAPALAMFAICWLNPAAYVDVLVMLGGMANQYGDPGRWYFAAGATCASLLWFPFLGFVASRYSEVLSQPRVWRAVNCAIGVIMCALVVKLLLS